MTTEAAANSMKDQKSKLASGNSALSPRLDCDGLLSLLLSLLKCANGCCLNSCYLNNTSCYVQVVILEASIVIKLGARRANSVLLHDSSGAGRDHRPL